MSTSFGVASKPVGVLQYGRRKYEGARATSKTAAFASAAAECPEEFVELAHRLADAAGDITSKYFR